MKQKVLIALSASVLLSGIAVFAASAAEPQKFDFGDAQDLSFPSLLASNGARHRDIGSIWLGTTVNAEADALVSDRDAGDDGLVAASPIKFRVTADALPSTPRPWYSRWLDALLGRARRKAYVNILIDRNNNGKWESPSEWVAQNQSVAVPRGQSLEFEAKGTSGAAVTWDKTVDGWLRITLTGNQLRNYDGTTNAPFAMGETEDYAPTNAPEAGAAVWCFVADHTCHILSQDEANEARDNKQELQGPYKTIAACTLECKKKPPFIETPPTPKRVPPPEKPVEKTISTKSPTPTPPASTEMHNLDLTVPTQQPVKTFTCPTGYPHARPGNWGDGDCTKGYCTAEDTLDSKYANFIYNNKIEKFVYVCGNLPRENACHDFPPAGVCPEAPMLFEQYQ